MDKNNRYDGIGYVPSSVRAGKPLELALLDMIDNMSDDYGMPPRMAEALRLDRVRLFTIGIESVDTKIRTDAKERLNNFLLKLRKEYLLLDKTYPFTTPDPVKWRQNQEKLKNEQHITDEWIHDEQAGLDLELMFSTVRRSMYFRYLPEALRGDSLETSLSELETVLNIETHNIKDTYDLAKVLHQTRRLIGLPTPEEKQTMPDEVLEEIRSEFSTRSEQSYYLAQLAASSLLLEQLYAFYMSGEPGSSMAALMFQQFKDQLFSDDPRLKMAMLRQLSGVLLRQSDHERSEVAKDYFKHLSTLTSTIGNDLGGYIDFLVALHMQNNIELPDYLLRYEEKAAQNATPETPIETPTTEVVSLPDDEEKLAALEEKINLLREKIEQAFEAVILTKNARIDANFAPFKEAFGKGFAVESLPGRFERVDSNHAKQLFDVLLYAYNLARQSSNSIQELHSLIAVSEQLTNELQALKAFAFEQNLSRLKQIEWPLVFPFIERIEDLKRHWDHIEWLMRSKWSADELSLESLRELLFASPQEEQSVPRRLTEEEARAFVDKHLNEVFFPGGTTVTEGEVREAARRAGFTQRQMEDLEWERVRDLAMVRDLTGGTLYDAKANEKFLGNEVPYFVVLFEHGGETYAVAESPIKGSATYVARGNSWSEILKAPRRIDARRLGARYVIHSTKFPYGDAHVEKVMNTVLEMHEE